MTDEKKRDESPLPPQWKKREWQEGWMYRGPGEDQHVFIGKDDSVTAADTNATTMLAVLAHHFVVPTVSREVDEAAPGGPVLALADEWWDRANALQEKADATEFDERARIQIRADTFRECCNKLRRTVRSLDPRGNRPVDEAAVRASDVAKLLRAAIPHMHEAKHLRHVSSPEYIGIAARIHDMVAMACALERTTERPAASGKDGATALRGYCGRSGYYLGTNDRCGVCDECIVIRGPRPEAIRDKGEDLARRTKVHDQHRENVAALLREGCICGDYAAITGALHPDCRAPHPDEVGDRIRNAKPDPKVPS